MRSPPPRLTLFPYTTLFRSSGGEEALAVAAADPPDLAVVDQNMPGMDGVTTTRELKALLADLEVVAFTAVPGAERQFAQAGATRSEEHTSELQSRRDLVCRL